MANDSSSFALRLNPADNVAVLKRFVKSGTDLGDGIKAARDITPGHKIAIAAIAEGAPVVKYGQIIGFARGTISPGDHVHVHNVVVKEFGRDYQFCADAKPVKYYPGEKMRTFQGFSRP